MPSRKSAHWQKARQAQDKLAAQFLDHPEVTLIDIGYQDEADKTTLKNLALRIHVRESWFTTKSEDRVAFPEQVNGIPVVVIRGEYTVGQ